MKDMRSKMDWVASDKRTLPLLTRAELGVLRRLAAGHTNAQIAQHVGRSEKTVRNHLTRVYAKLGVANRTEAVAVHLCMEYARVG